MRVCISIAEHELPMAHRWFDWICELGGTEGHSLHLIPVSGLDISALIPKARKAFGMNVFTIKDEEGETSDWQAKDLVRSASGPNSAFRQVAWDTYMNKRGPYFWCELDCIPLKKDWLNRLEAEYASCGKPFMGAKVEIESVPPHMSGNAIYPTNVPELAPMIVQRLHWVPRGQSQRFELAFDVAGAKDVLPKAHFTKLVQHIFRHKGFESRFEFDAVIDPNAVVFHSCKDGSIFKYLRENLSGGLSVGKSVADVIPSTPTAQNICDGAGEESHLSAEPVPSQSPEVWRGGRDPVVFVDQHGDERIKAGLGNVKPQGGDATCMIPTESASNTKNEQRKNVSSNAEPTVQTVGSASVVNQTFVSDEMKSVIEQNGVIKHGLPAMSPPWENREDTERDVQMLCNTLALFCKAPIYKSRVRNALREAKIIK